MVFFLNLFSVGHFVFLPMCMCQQNDLQNASTMRSGPESNISGLDLIALSSNSVIAFSPFMHLYMLGGF